MRILLYQPDNSRELLVGSYSVDPIGIEYISSVLTQAGNTVRIITKMVLSDAEFANELLNFKPDIVGFSVFTFFLERSLKLAQKVKNNFPDTITVFGGYHPTACPEVVENEFVDFVISGEGERAFRDLVDYIRGLIKFKNISGVFYWDNGLVGKRTSARVDFNSLPIPQRCSELLRNNKVRQIAYPSIGKQKCVAQVTYSRGCPYHCSFCNSQLMFPGKVIWRDPQHVIEEIRGLIDKFGTNLIFFSDLTFNASKKKLYQLCNEIIRNKLSINWCALCRIDNIDRDILIRMREAGCSKISYGIETVTDRVRHDVKHDCFVDKNEALEVIEMTSELGLLVRGLFILGLPSENPESIQELKNFIFESELDDLRISFFVPFPGTKLFSECEKMGLFLTEDFSNFTTTKPVIKLDGDFHLELYGLRKEIILKFYGSRKYKNHFLTKAEKFPFLLDSYLDYFRLLRQSDFITDEVFANFTSSNDYYSDQVNMPSLMEYEGMI